MGDPPNVIWRNVRSESRTSGPALSRRWMMVGTRKVWVTRSARIVSAMTSRSNPRRTTLQPPAAITGRSLEPLPCESGAMWR